MARNVILLNGDAREEGGIAAVYDITPGMLVERTGARNWQPHATAAGAALAAFAREQRENDGHGVDDDIPAGDEFTIIFPTKGAKINAFTSDTIAAGEFVESDGDGGVRAFAAGVKIGEAQAASVLPASGNGRVEIIIL
jgi:hypothetical protein